MENLIPDELPALQDEREVGCGENGMSAYMESIDLQLARLGNFLSENVRARIRGQLERMEAIAECDRTRSDQKQVKALEELIALQDLSPSISRMEDIAASLEQSHSGMEEVKMVLLNQLRLSILTGRRPKPILLVGAPGCGKTSLAISFAKALGSGWDKIQFSGMSGAFMLSGDDSSYKDAKPGRLVNALINCRSLSPVIILDEVDKAGANDQYGKAVNALLEILDDEQCMEFTDYFLTVPFNFSRVHFILTANSLEGIPLPVIDRCIVCRVKGYSFNEKKKICNGIIERMNSSLPSGRLVFRDEQVNALVLKDGSSPGVRGLKLLVENAFSAMGEELVSANGDSVIVKKRVIDSICSVPDLDLGYDFSPRAGSVPALVIGGGNGTLLPVEAAITDDVIPNVSVTGMAEKLLDESSSVAASVARHFIREHFLTDVKYMEIHYPYPIQKNGDSAGLAAFAAILSAFLKTGIREDFAITGAVTLTGQVLAVDGIIEKLLAAKRLGIGNVVVPLANEAELSQLPPSALKGVKIYFASSVEDIAALLFPSAINHVKVDGECREKTNSGSGLCR